MKNLTSEYIAGVVDADGSVMCAVQKALGRRIKFAVRPTVKISKRYIAGYFDCGGSLGVHAKNNYKIKSTAFGWNARIDSKDFQIIYKISDWCKKHNIKASLFKDKNNLTFSVQELKSVKKLLVLITPYLQSEKYLKSQIILHGIIPLVEKGEHLSNKGFLKIMRMVDILHFLSKRKGGYKHFQYNSCYFKSRKTKWGD